MSFNKGVNFGGYFSQCPKEKKHYDTFLTEKDVEQVKNLGFDHIRLPFDYELIEDSKGNELPEGITYLANFISWCKKNNLCVILDLHKAPGYDFNNAGIKRKNNLFTDKRLKQRFLTIWKRIAQNFGDDKYVAFELLNEVVEQENISLWNELINLAVTEIRKYAKETLIIYGGIQWNSASTVKYLEKPKDKNIMFTFHFYEPLIFTHQKASWVPGMIMNRDVFYPDSMDIYRNLSSKLGFKGKDVTDSEKKGMGKEFIKGMILEAIDAAKKMNVTLYCGEFGVIDKAPVQDTLNWFSDIMSLFNEYKIGSAVWTYKEKDFGISDEHYAPIYKQLTDLLTK